METIHVALMSMRPRLRDILTDALAGEPDMELIEWRDAPVEDLGRSRPDVVVCESADPLDAGLPTQMLRAIPNGRVLVVADSGDQAALFELQPARTVIRTVGIDQVIAAIRYGLAGLQPGFGQGSSGPGS